MIPARFLVSMEDDEVATKTLTVWRSAPLFRKPLTEEAELVLTQNLLTIEDLDEEAVPSTTNPTTHVNPPEKAQQVGPDAARKVLRGVLQGLQSPSGMRTALLLVDLSLHTCDFTRAAMLESFGGQLNMPLYYCGFGQTELKRDWAKEYMTDFVTTGLLSGEFPLPASATLPPVAIPADQVEAMPPQPQLLLMAWSQVKHEGLPSLRTPESVLKKWHDHPQFGEQFQSFLADLRKECPVDLPPSSKKGGGSGEDGRGRSTAVLASATASARVQPAPEEKAMNISDLPSPITWEAVVPASKKGAPT